MRIAKTQICIDQLESWLYIIWIIPIPTFDADSKYSDQTAQTRSSSESLLSA